jgi:hypothetical protein
MNRSYEDQGTGYDPGAAGHERQGRATRPREAVPHPHLIGRIQKQADELLRDAETNPDIGEQTKSAIRWANLTHAVGYLDDYARLKGLAEVQQAILQEFARFAASGAHFAYPLQTLDEIQKLLARPESRA